MWFSLSQWDKILKLPSLSGTSNKTRVLTSAASAFLPGYFIWLAEEAVPAEEASGQEDRHEGGGDVSHPGGGKALRVLWTLLSAAHSRKKLPCQGDILQPAEPQGRGQLCLCHRGLVCFVFSVFPLVLGWFSWGGGTRMSCCVVFSASLQEMGENQLVWWVLDRISGISTGFDFVVCSRLWRSPWMST